MTPLLNLSGGNISGAAATSASVSVYTLPFWING
eukprot:CAMPEP_0194256662 /NCGR_PEP_ID=MMETSP0158-20130606/37201_1 /TAXON_ID=33649 /ORGANISM="Thalassionema nitzschioides, Strain L26-B" /LENGTH=33 /DNA_ID= /DNA_START= /DNA_END= /DNA_ORIENTATION=